MPTLTPKRTVTPAPKEELGTLGLDLFGGQVQMAPDSDLYWPQAYEIFNRIRRSDPEIGGIVRPIFTALGRGVQLEWSAPPDANKDEMKATEYGREVLEDLDGGQTTLVETIASYVPFMGWAWWEELWGLRTKGWTPPDKNDQWESQFDDGLPTIRRYAWRDHSSFEKWHLDEKTGRLLGMVQHDPPSSPITLPINRSLHLTFGDPVSPEGLSPLEAVWRLERMKYGFEVIQSLGFQHAAGYAKFTAAADLSDEDKAYVRMAARAIMLPQEGNFILLPGHIDASIMDSSFASAPALLETIRYYGLVKLQLFTMQWAAIATTAGTGALASHSDSSEMALIIYNSMWQGFANQLDAQMGRRLFSHPAVRAAFPKMVRRPKLKAIPVEKGMPLNLVSQFISQLAPFMPLGPEDLLAIRKQSGFLPQSLPSEPKAQAIPPLPPFYSEGDPGGAPQGPNEADGKTITPDAEADSPQPKVEVDEEDPQLAAYKAAQSLLIELQQMIDEGKVDLY